MSKSQSRPKTDKRKAPKTAWKKGQSGNPGGRPKATEAQRLAKERKAQAQPEMVEVLVSIANNPEARDQDRVAAAKAVLDGLDAVKLEVSGEVSHEVDAAGRGPVELVVDIGRLQRVAEVLQRAGVVSDQHFEEPKDPA